MYRVLVSPRTPAPVLDMLRDSGFELKTQTSTDEGITAREIAGCDGFLMDEGTCTARLLHSAPQLKVIGKESSGLDSIDVACAQELGIWVTCARGANARSVAEHTMALILACAKNLVTMDHITRAGGWPRRERPTLDVYGSTLGIIGLGAIGKLVARLALAFGMHVLAYDPAAAEFPDGVRRAETPDALLPHCDYVSLHVPLNDHTYHMIGARQFALMKPTSFLINCARGAIVDEDALVWALEEKQIRGAALDAFSVEPPEPDSPLLVRDDVIVSPHNAAFTEETTLRMWEYAAQGICEVLSGELPRLPGNRPAHPRMPLRP